MATTRICSIEACGKPHRSRGYCRAHYKRFMAYGDPLAGSTAHGAPEAWVHEHLSYSGAECLIWPFARLTNGYACIRHKGNAYGASRYICELAHGPAPQLRDEAAHSCGNGHLGCVSPAHLSWKTTADNEADKVAHGTHNRGIRHPLAKLSEADVRAIFHDPRPVTVIALDYGVSHSAISGIKHRRNWRSLDMLLTP